MTRNGAAAVPAVGGTTAGIPEDDMRRRLTLLFVFAATLASAQDLLTPWDELTASEWRQALERSNHTAILPIGVLESTPAVGRATGEIISDCHCALR
jgi:hypothetical protein